MGKDDSRDERVSVENNPNLSDEEKVDQLKAIDQPEPDSELGKTIEGGAALLGTVLTGGALEALPGGDEEGDDRDE
jgi:hypothetical protein